MSKEVQVQFEVREMFIMKETLEQMGINYQELNEHQLEIKKSYHNIVIDAQSGIIRYDDMDKKQIDKIKQGYMVNFYKDKAIREGNKVTEEVQANGEIILHITN